MKSDLKTNKKVHRFYVSNSNLIDMWAGLIDYPSLIEQTFTYSGEHSQQFVHVLRFQPGNVIILFNEVDGEIKCEFTVCNKKGIVLKVLENSGYLSKKFCEIYAYVPLLKKESFDLMLEKLTELGVSTIIPTVSTHTQISDINNKRAQKIIIEATEQSGQIVPLKIEEIIYLDKKEILINSLSNLDYIFILHPYSIEIPTVNHGETVKKPQNKSLFSQVTKLVGDYQNKKTKLKDQVLIGLLIGPEGGFSDLDLKNILSFIPASKISVVSIGQSILRAETAAIVSCSLVLQGFATLSH